MINKDNLSTAILSRCNSVPLLYKGYRYEVIFYTSEAICEINELKRPNGMLKSKERILSYRRKLKEDFKYILNSV